MTGGHFAAQHEASPMASLWQLRGSAVTGWLLPNGMHIKKQTHFDLHKLLTGQLSTAVCVLYVTALPNAYVIEVTDHKQKNAHLKIPWCYS